MSQYYNPKRTKFLYDPETKEPFKISRSKIDLFIQCPRCFYLDLRLGVKRPPGFPFTLNNAVDTLLKKEFDIHRVAKTAHPLMKTYGIEAVPYQDKRLDEWRDAMRRGISCKHEATNLIIRGGIDDVWVNDKGELIIVDYKATSKDQEVTLDDEWKDGYKRQMEIYQWLFRQNGFRVSDTGYFVYVNGRTDKEALDGKLDFDVSVLPYKGSDKWVEKAILTMKKVLDDPRIPKAKADCDYCGFVNAINEVTKENANGHAKAKKSSAEEKGKKLF